MVLWVSGSYTRLPSLGELFSCGLRRFRQYLITLQNIMVCIKNRSFHNVKHMLLGALWNYCCKIL